MGKQEVVLTLCPAKELRFRGPFTSAVVDELNLTNPTDKAVAYKVKTTAPKSYSVRPSSGVLHPLGTVNIKVTLQPFDFDPNDKLRHRFMIQAAYSSENVPDFDAFWKALPADAVMESKLKSVLEPQEVPADAPQPRAPSSPAPAPAKKAAEVKSTPPPPVVVVDDPSVTEKAASSSPKPTFAVTSSSSSSSTAEDSQVRRRPVSDTSPKPSAAPAPDTTTQMTTAKRADSSNILLVLLVLIVVFAAAVQFMYR